MAEPIVVSIPKNGWAKVADAVTAGNIYIKKVDATYHHRYVTAGGAAPTDGDLVKASPLPEPGLPIGIDIPSDVYVHASGYAGEVTVAL